MPKKIMMYYKYKIILYRHLMIIYYIDKFIDFYDFIISIMIYDWMVILHYIII